MSFAPKPGPDGLRRYNKWSGNPGGTKEDPTCCIESVTPNERGGFARRHQCNRKRGHGPDGLYCKQHDPAVVAARQEANRKRSEERWEAHMRPHRMSEDYRKALRAIADGHNDPRALAIETLAKYERPK